MEAEANATHAVELQAKDTTNQASSVSHQQLLAAKDAENQRLASELSAFKEQTKPLEIDMPSTVRREDISERIVWKDDFVARVSNQNQTREVVGVVVRLLKIDPPLNGRKQYGSCTTDDCALRNIKFKFNDFAGDTLNGGVIGHVSILEAERTSLLTKVKFCGQWSSSHTNEFIPEPNKEYIFTMEVTANTLNRKEAQFKVSFPMPSVLPIVMSTAITTNMT